jgi:hypothetical protein
MINFPEQLAPLSHTEQSVFLMMLGDIPIYPLPVSDVQKFTNEMVCPIKAC